METFIGRLNTKSRRLVSSKDRGEVCAMGFNCICNVYFLNKMKKSDSKGKWNVYTMQIWTKSLYLILISNTQIPKTTLLNTEHV